MGALQIVFDNLYSPPSGRKKEEKNNNNLTKLNYYNIHSFYDYDYDYDYVVCFLNATAYAGE